MELTVLMPCLNEAETLEICLKKAADYLERERIEGEIVVSDNGSTDGSLEIAQHFFERRPVGRIVHAKMKGYGNALITGCKAARGKYVIMGDADDSYDFSNLNPFLEKLREGYDLVMGNRFMGGIEKGAMPWSHQYIGNPILSGIGRLFFRSSIKDFHCGLRGYNREKILALELQTGGMEYASEMVVKAQLNNLTITEVPTCLRKDGRTKPPHLNTIRDGWRHLKFLFMYAPNWLFLYPALIFLALGIIGSGILLFGQLNVFHISFSIHTLLYFSFFIIIGFDIVDLYVICKLFAYNHHFFPRQSKDWNCLIKEDWFIFGGAILALLGGVIAVVAVIRWSNTGFSSLVPETMMRLAIPSVAFLSVGVVSFFSGFLMAIIKTGIHQQSGDDDEE